MHPYRKPAKAVAPSFFRAMADVSTPVLHDDDLDTLGNFYCQNERMHCVPFIQFAIAPLTYARACGVESVGILLPITERIVT